MRITLLLLMQFVATIAIAQTPRTARDSSLTGSFKSGDDAGCALQSRAVGADSVRLQLGCVTGPPAYNLGFVDTRLRVVAGVAVYETAEYGGRCRIEFRFRGASVDIQQTEDRFGCGFGARVSATGALERISTAPPPFDLAPYGTRAPP